MLATKLYSSWEGYIRRAYEIAEARQPGVKAIRADILVLMN